MRISKVEKSTHYEMFQEHGVPWSEVLDVVRSSKARKKCGNKVRILTEKYYILGMFEDGVLIVISAKRR